MSHEIIFHHYWTSPFSEKIRVYFGMKGLAWRSVEIPNMMPKPDLMPLTGGYRKTPVMQIGADIYCDTQIILRALERRFPDPPVMPNAGLSFGLAFWSDRPFFQATVPLIFGELGPMVPEAFKKDREAMFPERPFNADAMKAMIPAFKDQWRAHCALIEAQLAARGDFLGGTRSVSDIHAHMNVWFLKQFFPPTAEALLKEFPRVGEWFERIKAIGHGKVTPMDAKEALAIARAAESTEPVTVDPFEPNGRKPGDRVKVMADDYGRDAVEGVIVSTSAHHIAIKRSAPECGEVVVHFPRAGFFVMPA